MSKSQTEWGYSKNLECHFIGRLFFLHEQVQSSRTGVMVTELNMSNSRKMAITLWNRPLQTRSSSWRWRGFLLKSIKSASKEPFTEQMEMISTIRSLPTDLVRADCRYLPVTLNLLTNRNLHTFPIDHYPMQRVWVRFSEYCCFIANKDHGNILLKIDLHHCFHIKLWQPRTILRIGRQM